MAKGGKKTNPAPEIINRRARHEFAIGETLEVGVALQGSEVKSIRDGKASLAEGFVRVSAEPPSMLLMGVHIDEYPPASGINQHDPTRHRTLLAHKRQILEFAKEASAKGTTVVPLKMYFKNGRVKVLIGVARGKQKFDKRQDARKREADRDIRRAMSKRV